METPYLKVPAVNVGRRQSQRTHAENVFFVPHDKEAIVAQLSRIQDDPETRNRIRNCANPFGDGHAGERVAGLLAETPIDGRLLNKDLTY